MGTLWFKCVISGLNGHFLIEIGTFCQWFFCGSIGYFLGQMGTFWFKWVLSDSMGIVWFKGYFLVQISSFLFKWIPYGKIGMLC